ncbi:MAG: AbrB/MazE/SpoVT family DNA-binding domain-containing protein [Arenicellales bacterium]
MQTSEVSVGKQGRIVIPASIRNELAISSGARLVAWVEDGKLIMESKDQLWQSIQNACKTIPPEIDLAQALIDERRLAAQQENNE